MKLFDRIAPGDTVEYWTAPAGERPRPVQATVLQVSSDGQHARVRRLDDCGVPVQSVETKRLRVI